MAPARSYTGAAHLRGLDSKIFLVSPGIHSHSFIPSGGCTGTVPFGDSTFMFPRRPLKNPRDVSGSVSKQVKEREGGDADSASSTPSDAEMRREIGPFETVEYHSIIW